MNQMKKVQMEDPLTVSQWEEKLKSRSVE